MVFPRDNAETTNDRGSSRPVVLLLPDGGGACGAARAALCEIEGFVEAEAPGEALERLGPDRSGVVVVGGGDALEAERMCAEAVSVVSGLSGVSVIALVPRDSASCAAACVRAGAADVVPWPESASGELACRVRGLLGLHGVGGDAAGTDGAASRRRSRLKKLVSGTERIEAGDAFAGGGPSTPLEMSMWDELGEVLRQELDIDGLLRTLLESLLSRVGSTNAAIYFPTQNDLVGIGGDWSLAAYINYDLAQDHAEVMLDQLATFVPETVAGSAGVTRVPDDRGEAAFGPEAHWLAGQDSLLACAHDTVAGGEAECLAVVHLFRDPVLAYTQADETALRLGAALLGEQMSRVIRVHHRSAAGPHGAADEFDGEHDADTDTDAGTGGLAA